MTRRKTFPASRILPLLAVLFSAVACASEAPFQKADSSLPLPEMERVYIAEIEHQGLTLMRKGFPAMAAAIRSGEAPKLIHFLSPAFRGETLDPNQGAGPENEVLKVRRAASSKESAATQVVDASAFAQYLIGLRNRFGP